MKYYFMNFYYLQKELLSLVPVGVVVVGKVVVVFAAGVVVFGGSVDVVGGTVVVSALTVTFIRSDPTTGATFS